MIQLDFTKMFLDTIKVIFIFWPFLLLLGFLVLIKIFIDKILPKLVKNFFNKRKFYKGEKWRNDRELLLWLRNMKPKEFEEYIANLFSNLGYKTKTVGKSHDGGIDVIAEKNGRINYIQCKKFITSQVTVGDVRDFYGSLVDHLTNGKGYFITTNKFTLEAEKFAEDKPIELIDSFDLIRYIKMAKKDNL